MTTGAIILALGVSIVAPAATTSAATDLAPGEEAFLEGEGGKAAIPYTRFWLNADGATYYMRSSASVSFLYLGMGTISSYYNNYPTNWRLIQSGSYRLLKNSSTGKCLWADIQTTGTMLSKMADCDTSNSNQRFTVMPVTVDGMPRVNMYYTEGENILCLGATKPIGRYSNVTVLPCYFNDVFYGSYANLR